MPNEGWRRRQRASFSSWRIRSRVRLNSSPISSRVRGHRRRSRSEGRGSGPPASGRRSIEIAQRVGHVHLLGHLHRIGGVLVLDEVTELGAVLADRLLQ